MKVLVLGGSNSLSTAGYVDRMTQILRSNLGDRVVVDNVSIGASTTLGALARLFEVGATGRSYDVVIYEFALNDGLFLSGFPQLQEQAQASLQLLLAALSQIAPQAALVPVLLSPWRTAGPQSVDQVYEVHRKTWSALDQPVADIRRLVSYVFASKTPRWVYGDLLHYSRPHGADMVGSLVARHVLEQAKQSDRLNVGAAYAAFLERFGAFPLSLRYLSASQLSAFCTGKVEEVNRTNSVMSVQALRLRPGSALRLEGRLLSLSILSDRRHAWCRMQQGDAGQGQCFLASTRLKAVDDPLVNPPEKDRFFYAGLPIPLLLREPILRQPAPDETWTIDLVSSVGAPPQLHASFMFDSAPAWSSQDRSVDIAGALLATVSPGESAIDTQPPAEAPSRFA